MVRFLIIRLSSIGDVVLTTPVLRNLKRQLPGSEIHFLVKPAFRRVLEGNPYVDKIHEYAPPHKELTNRLKEESFDYVIDLQNNLRTVRIRRTLKRLDFTVNKINFRKWLMVHFRIDRLPRVHIVDRYMDTLKLFDVINDREGLDFFLLPEDEPSGIPPEYREGYVLLVHAAAHATKKMPLEMMANLIDRIERPVVLAGGSAEAEDGQALEEMCSRSFYNAVGKYSLGTSAALVQDARVVISPDTGLMHIAAAFRKKILSVWGNTIPEFGMYPYFPHEASCVFEVPHLPCRPCSKIGYNKCPKRHFRCMKEQDLDALVKECHKIF